MNKKIIRLVFVWCIIFAININIFAKDKQTILERYLDCSINEVPCSRELLLQENQSVMVSDYKVSLIQSLYDKNVAQSYCVFKVESLAGKKIENSMVDEVGRSLNGECFGKDNRYTFDIASDFYSGYSIQRSAINENDSIIVFVKIIGLGFNNFEGKETLRVALIDNFADVVDNTVKEFEISDRTKAIELHVNGTSKMFVSPLGIFIEGPNVSNIEIYMKDGSIVKDSIRIAGNYENSITRGSSYVFEELLDIEKIDKIVVDGKCVQSHE